MEQKVKKGKCVNSDCKSSNNLDPTNVEKYGTCGNCKGLEHYRCAKVDTQIKSTYQKGSLQYLCTECLSRDPALALQQVTVQQVTEQQVAVQQVTEQHVTEQQVTEKQITNLLKDFRFGSIPSADPKFIAIDVAIDIVEDVFERIEGRENAGQERQTPRAENEPQKEPDAKQTLKCKECDVQATSEAQLETHRRLKHIDVINFNCDECSYSSSTKVKMEEHISNIHKQKVVKIKCKTCDFRAETQKEGECS